MVQLALQESWNAEYRIVDATGRLVLSGQTMGKTRLDISTEQLSEGFYEVVLTDGARTAVSKLMIQH
jgi:hypothetical protein